MFSSTAQRVPEHTADHVNAQIRAETEANIDRYAAAGSQAIARRMAELDQEWDIERCVETLAPSFTLLGMTLGLTVNRRWFIFPFVVQAFFLQHALQGWCPPVPILRRLGVRTQTEIDHERCALQQVLSNHEPRAASAAAEATAAG
jgi:hypothetical protein